MGHQHILTLPDTQPWNRPVQLLAEDADLADITRQTMRAALKGLELARNDRGLIYSFHLLCRTARAAREPVFAEALGIVSVFVRSPLDICELITAFCEAVDRELVLRKGRTDISEMGQLAAIETLTTLLQRKSTSLYAGDQPELKVLVYELSTKSGVESLAHEFFSRFCHRFLGYHLGRELSNHVGGNGRFADPQSHTEFLERLLVHCREVAAITTEYAGKWYSHSNFDGGIDYAKARRFVNRCLGKLEKEFERRAEP